MCSLSHWQLVACTSKSLTVTILVSEPLEPFFIAVGQKACLPVHSQPLIEIQGRTLALSSRVS